MSQAKERTTGERTHREARKRTGCWICKQKHVRCTEERPTCARCIRLKLDCSYEIKLLWKEDAIQRGICLGREGIWSRAGKRAVKTQEPHTFVDTFKGEYIFLNVHGSHFEQLHGEDQDIEESLQEFDNAKAVLPNGPPPTLAEPSHSEHYLTKYFFTRVVAHYGFDNRLNLFVKHLMPLFPSYEPLRHAVIAAGANQLRVVGYSQYAEKATLYKSKAISGLQQSINGDQVGWPFICTILMLCFFEISDGCNASWMTHLRGGLRGLAHAQSNGSTNQNALRSFLLMWFQTHRIMAYTEHYDPIDDAHLTWDPSDDLDEIDIIFGVSRNLLDLIDETSRLSASIVQLISNHALSPDEIRGLQKCKDSIEDRLQSLTFTLNLVAHDPVKSHIFYEVAEVKRMAAILYLHEKVTSILPGIESAPRTALIDSLAARLQPLPPNSTLVWPIFVLARASTDNESHRRAVLEKFNEMLEPRNLGNIRLAKRIIEDDYRDVDLCRRRTMPTDQCKWWADATLRGRWISLA